MQLFASTASAVAMKPLARTDLATLVDPYALELDQDYDCAHSSNPGTAASTRRGSPSTAPGGD